MTNKDIATKDIYEALKVIVTNIERSGTAETCEPGSDMQRVCNVLTKTGQFHDAIKALRNYALVIGV